MATALASVPYIVTISGRLYASVNYDHPYEWRLLR